MRTRVDLLKGLAAANDRAEKSRQICLSLMGLGETIRARSGEKVEEYLFYLPELLEMPFRYAERGNAVTALEYATMLRNHDICAQLLSKGARITLDCFYYCMAVGETQGRTFAADPVLLGMYVRADPKSTLLFSSSSVPWSAFDYALYLFDMVSARVIAAEAPDQLTKFCSNAPHTMRSRYWKWLFTLGQSDCPNPARYVAVCSFAMQHCLIPPSRIARSDFFHPGEVKGDLARRVVSTQFHSRSIVLLLDAANRGEFDLPVDIIRRVRLFVM